MQRYSTQLLTALILVTGATAATTTAAAEPSAAAKGTAEWIRPANAAQLGSPNAALAASDVAAATDAYLASQRTALDLNNVVLERERVLSAGNLRTVRYRQLHGGTPVVGGQVAIRTQADSAIRGLMLQVNRTLHVSTIPSVSASEAKAIVSQALGLSLPRTQTSLAVWPDENGGRLTWQVDIAGPDGGRRIMVDAHSAELLLLRTLGTHALGRVYPINPVVTPTLEDLELLDLTVAAPQYLNGWSGGLAVTNYVSGSSMDGYVVDQTVVPNSGEDFLYDPPANPTDPADEFAQVMVYYHLTRMRDFFTNTLSVDMAPASWQLTAAVNLLEGGAPLDNAFFSPMGIDGAFAAPNFIGIGQGSAIDFSLDSDVFDHEFTHYVSANAIGYNAGQTHATEYGLSPFSGSIDEGLSDYFACTVNGDPLLGEASGIARDLTDTSKSCPDDMVGEVHADGEIIGSFAWTMHEELGEERADQLIWGAMTMMPFGGTFGDFGRATQQTADDLLAAQVIDATERQFIDDRMAARGLDECDVELPLRKDEPRRTTLFGLDIIGQLLGGTCADAKTFGVSLQSFFHFTVTPEAGDELVRFLVNLAPTSGGPLDWAIYARKAENVTFKAGAFFPSIGEFDYVLGELSGTDGELVIDADSDPPFDPSATYHMVIVHQNCPATRATVFTSALPVEPGEGGAGGGPVGPGGEGGSGGSSDTPPRADNSDDGCGCRITGAPATSEWAGWLVFVGAAGVWLRRRRP